MTFEKITCAGAGTMGSQVAWQMAMHGKHITVYDAVPDGLDRGKRFHREFADFFVAERGAARRQVDDALAHITYTTELPAAVRDADLVSESVPESVAIKQSFWRDVSRHAPEHTVFTTNTSTLAPSTLVSSVDRPRQFLALHFAIGVWDAKIGEIMGHPGTDVAVFEQVLTFAAEIGLVPIPIREEHEGYLSNSLIVPWCTAALDLLVRGVSDFESIDRTWMIALMSPMGPFGMIDRMGLGVVHHVATLLAEETEDRCARERVRYLDKHFIQSGRLGTTSGEGFYTYPDPAYTQPGFI
jgi:3-hydroxybutyryl-CoA dehydrogenase